MDNSNNERRWNGIAGINGFIAVVMGAIAAHAIKDASLAVLAEKASLYQLIHSGILLWLSGRQEKNLRMARLSLITRIILFCGALYITSLTGWSEITYLAPAGGILLMIGWLLIALTWICAC